MNTQFKSLLHESSKLLSGQILGISLSVITAIAVARMLGVEGRGVYAFVMTISAIGMQVALMGCDNTCKKLAAKNKKNIPSLIGYSISLSLIGSLLAMFLCYLWANMSDIGASNKVPLILAIACIPFMTMNASFANILMADAKAGQSAKASLYAKIILIILFGYLILENNVTLYTVMGANLIATILGFMMSYKLLRKHFNGSFKLNLTYLKGMWKYSASAYISVLLFFIMYKIDIIMIGDMLGAEVAGHYGIATAMTDVMIAPAAALGMILMVKLAGEEDKTYSHKKLHKKAQLITAMLVGAGCTFTAIISPYIIPLMFGAEFTDSVPILQILCIAVFFMSLYLIEQNRITAQGRARQMLSAPLAGSITNIALNFYLIPIYGGIGSAWASVAAYALAWGCAKFFTKKRA